MECPNAKNSGFFLVIKMDDLVEFIGPLLSDLALRRHGLTIVNDEIRLSLPAHDIWFTVALVRNHKDNVREILVQILEL